MRRFSCDFETTTDLNDCRVWAYACCEIGDPDNFLYGNSLDSFMDWCAGKDNYLCFFHNLKFDGAFIVEWLLKNGFEYVENKKDRKDNSFTTLITDMGQWYQIIVWFKVKGHKVNKVTFQDSLKILNMSVEAIAKGFDLPIRKLELDYKAKREIGHELTDHEIDYIRNDVEIISRALDAMFKLDLSKMTIASDALASFKSMCNNFKRLFPELTPEVDADIRPSYKGGFTYVSDKYAGKEVGEGVVFDVNSLYPSRMMYELLPVGQPEPFTGRYIRDANYPLFIQNLECVFELKPDKIPSIQIKHSLSFMQNEYLKSSNGEIVSLMLTKPDLELFFEQYNVEVVSWNGGYKFKQAKGIFDEYIKHWTESKIQAKKDNNRALYQISKLMLNSLYGKFGTGLSGKKKNPVLVDGKVQYINGEEEEKKGVYLPVASFITAYARKYTIETSQMIRDWSERQHGVDAYVYSDTDSIHATLSKSDVELLCDIIDIDDFRLGAWKHESSFKRAKFIRQKCYIEQDYDDTINVTIAGFPKKLGHLITFDNFKIGFTTEGLSDEEIGPAGRKLRYKHVNGGVVLVDTDFTLK